VEKLRETHRMSPKPVRRRVKACRFPRYCPAPPRKHEGRERLNNRNPAENQGGRDLPAYRAPRESPRLKDGRPACFIRTTRILASAHLHWNRNLHAARRRGKAQRCDIRCVAAYLCRVHPAKSN
jgi:hypothetical protein